MAYTCRNRDARARTATHSRYTCGDTSHTPSTPTARLQLCAGKHVHRPVMASTCCNRDAPAHTATYGKRNRVATTPLPVHSSLWGSSHGRENACARQSWPHRVATETHRHTQRRTRVQHRSPSISLHRHTPPRTASESVSLQRRSPSTPASEAPTTPRCGRAGKHVRTIIMASTCFVWDAPPLWFCCASSCGECAVRRE